jgi:two-component system, OmpR family, KDP operon response regulator KdpE
LEDLLSLTILIIDDEPQIRRALKNALADDETRVLEAGTAEEGIDLGAAQRPDVVILDLGLPDRDGLTVCREIRKWSDAPILVLSARHGEKDKTTLLDAGADDFITKPFSTNELKARLRALLRRVQRQDPAIEPMRVEGIEIDLATRTLRRDGQIVHLTPTEWDLIRVLVGNRDRTLTHRFLFDAVWPRSGGDAREYLRVYIANLRRKLERDPVRPRIILTEPGVGYRFQTG